MNTKTRLTNFAAICALLAGAPLALAAPKTVDYPDPNGDAGGMRYSKLIQITPANVGKLQKVWQYDLGTPSSSNENTPIMVGGVVYGVSFGKVYAIDAATGAEKWSWEAPAAPGAAPGGRRSAPSPRGEAWWTDGKESRLIVTQNNLVWEFDPKTGKPIDSFGNGGKIDLNDNLRGAPEDNRVSMGGAVNLYKNLFFTNGGVNEQTPASPGDIRAWDVRTGKLVWTFHTIPHPGEVGADTWPQDAWMKAGGANDWVSGVVDTKTGTVFVGTGSAADDYYGGERAGSNRFADSLIALDAMTGKRLWDFQAVHHDLWDADFAAPPLLATMVRGGKSVDVVVGTNKTGNVYVLDRKTGKPMFPIEERPVPPTTVPGDTAWPTQPHPSLPEPVSRQMVTKDELTNRTPEAHAYALQKFNSFVSGPQFTPAAFNKETIVAPGFSGGDEWGGMSFDPRLHYVFVNSENIAWSTSVTERKPGQDPKEPHSRYSFAGYHKFYDQEGYPATAAPWGYLTAIDLSSGKTAWRIPFGSYPALTAKGMPDTGSESYGGGVATATGVFLIAATNFDNKFHAFDSKTGKLLWETQLPYTGNATPITYMMNGRQYVVISTSNGRGGARGMPGRGAAVVAYALPN